MALEVKNDAKDIVDQIVDLTVRTAKLNDELDELIELLYTNEKYKAVRERFEKYIKEKEEENNG